MSTTETPVGATRPILIGGKSMEWLVYKDPVPHYGHFFDKLELAPPCGNHYIKIDGNLQKYNVALKSGVGAMCEGVILIVSVKSLAKFVALAERGLLGESYTGPTPMFSRHLLAVIKMNNRAEAVAIGTKLPCNCDDTALVFEGGTCVADLN